MVGSLSEAGELVNGLKSERNQKALGLCSEGSSSLSSQMTQAVPMGAGFLNKCLLPTPPV